MAVQAVCACWYVESHLLEVIWETAASPHVKTPTDEQRRWPGWFEKVFWTNIKEREKEDKPLNKKQKPPKKVGMAV